ncbi:uncharacterized protein LOC116617272 [Nematostella vectensis]|uniref:uncharacterized protein LOC116617272 n=1 Tax=Nematostella vectensis TaxID=45351 RepID=UPI0020775E6B|nr:uncharacterized protein LOC116617272 [Nematostella vectensis]
MPCCAPDPTNPFVQCRSKWERLRCMLACCRGQIEIHASKMDGPPYEKRRREDPKEEEEGLGCAPPQDVLQPTECGELGGSGQATSSLDVPARRTYRRQQVLVQGMDEQWQADLCDMQAFHRDNEAVKYLLTVIDVLSKFAWVVPLKDKTGTSLVEAFTTVFRRGRVPEKLQTDDGTEFRNRVFQDFLKNRGIRHFFTKSEAKHSEGPAEVVTPDDAQEVWATLYPEAPAAEAITGETPTAKSKKKTPPRFQVGDQVRLSKVKQTFTKGYLPNWTEEVFTVGQVLDHVTPTAYILREWDGDALEGRFYEPELQKVHVTEAHPFKIDRVLKTWKRGGRGEYWVHWKGWPDKYNSWVPATEVHKVL